MNNAAFNIAMVFKADVASAKAGLADISTGLTGVAAEAGKASAAAKKEAADLEAMAVAAAKAARAHQDLATAEQQAQAKRNQTLIAPLAVASPTVAPVTAIWRASDTAASSLRDTVAGLSATVGTQAHNMVEAAQSSALYQAALDDVRASFNPLFAASRQYEQQLDRIAEAERLGAITAREAAHARAQAANVIAPSVPGGVDPVNPGISSAYTSNVAAQGFDIGVTAAMGMNPLMIGLQQGTQVAQVAQQMGGGKQALQGIAAGFMSILSPMTLATVGFVTFGAIAIQALMTLWPTTKTTQERLDALTAATSRSADAAKNARRDWQDLAAEFGTATRSAQAMYEIMAEIERRDAAKAAADTIKTLRRDVTGGWSQYGSEVGSATYLMNTFGEGNWQDTYATPQNAPASFRVLAGVENLESAREGGSLDQQIAAANALLQLMNDAALLSGKISEDENAMLRSVGTLVEQLGKQKGIEENSAGVRAADEMIRQYQQQIELAAVALDYGKDSTEYRSAENRLARENLIIEMEKLGITAESDKGKELLGKRAEEAMARERLAEKARDDAQRNYLTGQDDQIRGMQREVALIGASQAERIRANALAEAEVEIRERSLSIRHAEEVSAKALAKAEAEIVLERQKALRAISVQSMGDSYDARISLTADPYTHGQIEFQKEFSQQLADGAGVIVAYNAAMRVRNKTMSDAMIGGQVQMRDMMQEVTIRRDLADQVAAGTITAEDANRLLREELELRPLILAAARAEGTEKKRLLDIVEGLRVAYAAMAAEDRRQNQNDYLRGQAERIQQLQIELALVGQTAAVRGRVLASIKAEQDIRKLGLDGAAAEEARRTAQAEQELTRVIEARADAFNRAQSAGEGAIDGMLDKLKSGDVGGAVEEFLGSIADGMFDLSVRNPVKNALFGANLGTMQDVGGLQGIWDRLSGKAPALDEKALVTQGAMPVQAMTVQAANVMLSGNLAGLGAAFGPAANANIAPFGPLPGSADVQAQIWQFFAGKGLQPHHIAGIMGNGAGESGFDPMAVGDNGTSFGLFQHHAGRGQGLLDAVGGRAGLGNVQAQLEYVWHELQTSENPAFKRLLASTDTRGATEAFLGFERPQGYNLADPSGSHGYAQRIAAAEAALTKFGATAQTASTDLGTLGGGMGAFGTALQGFAQGGPAGALQGLLGAIGTGIAGALGIPGYATGGDHKGGWRIVGENGPELEATGASRIFNASQTREILTSRAPAMVAANSPAPVVNIQPVLVNNTGRPVEVETEETVDARGQRQTKYVISDAVADGLAARGGKAARVMRNSYGAKPAGRIRP